MQEYMQIKRSVLSASECLSIVETAKETMT